MIGSNRNIKMSGFTPLKESFGTDEFKGTTLIIVSFVVLNKFYYIIKVVLVFQVLSVLFNVQLITQG